MCGLTSDLVICKFRKSIVIHDTECLRWYQVSLNNTNPTQTSFVGINIKVNIGSLDIDTTMVYTQSLTIYFISCRQYADNKGVLLLSIKLRGWPFVVRLHCYDALLWTHIVSLFLERSIMFFMTIIFLLGDTYLITWMTNPPMRLKEPQWKIKSAFPIVFLFSPTEPVLFLVHCTD